MRLQQLEELQESKLGLDIGHQSLGLGLGLETAESWFWSWS